eukprot:2077206-Lingulodinium_polyedra.AAC.1
MQSTQAAPNSAPKQHLSSAQAVLMQHPSSTQISTQEAPKAAPKAAPESVYAERNDKRNQY